MKSLGQEEAKQDRKKVTRSASQRASYYKITPCCPCPIFLGFHLWGEIVLTLWPADGPRLCWA